MLVRDLMEKKQLNLNRPLLSVRRVTSKIASESDNKRKSIDNPLPYYKSELNSGPVRNAGAIPFQWEKTPGKPKDMSVIEEGIGSTLSNPQNTACLDKKVIKHESEEDGIEEKVNSDSDSDDGDESFQDARDTLSRTESFVTRCSMSVYDDHEAQVNPYGSFSGDEKARDFMIDRFLPAAKAIISENSQRASKKPVLIGQGQKKQPWKIGSAEKSSPLNQHRPKSLRHKEGGILESDGSQNFPTNTTACGLFPHFCLSNPMPGVRTENKVQNNAGCNSTASPIETKKEVLICLYLIFFHFWFWLQFQFISLYVYFISLVQQHARPQLERGCGEPLARDSTQLETSYESPIVEKILYVDSIQKTKFQMNHKGDSSLDNSQRLDVVNVKAASEAKISQSLDLEHAVEDNDEKIDLESECGVNLGYQELSDATNFFEIPLVLPPLKAPSESWLKRTLPTISTKNTSSKSKPCCKYSFMTASLCPKRETIVNSSNVQHGVVQLHEVIQYYLVIILSVIFGIFMRQILSF